MGRKLSVNFMRLCRPESGSVYSVPNDSGRAAVVVVQQVAEDPNYADFVGAYYILPTGASLKEWSEHVSCHSPDWVAVTVSHGIGNGTWALVGTVQQAVSHARTLTCVKSRSIKGYWEIWAVDPRTLSAHGPVRPATAQEALSMVQQGKSREGYVEAKLGMLARGEWHPDYDPDWKLGWTREESLAWRKEFEDSLKR